MNLEDIHGITKHLQPAPVPAGNPWNNASKKLSISKKNDLIDDPNDNNIKTKQVSKDKENIEINDRKGKQEKKKSNLNNAKVQKDIDLQQLNDSIEEVRRGINNFSIKYNNKNDNKNHKNDNKNHKNDNYNYNNSNMKEKAGNKSRNERNHHVNNTLPMLPIPSPNLNSQSFYLKGNSNNNNRRLSSPSMITPTSPQFEFSNLNNNFNFNNINPINFNSTFNPYIRNGYYHPVIEQNGYQQLPIQPRIYYNNQINDRGHIQPYFPMMIPNGIPNGIPIPINTSYLNNNNSNYQFRNDNFYYGNISPTVQTPYNGDFSDYEEEGEEGEEEEYNDQIYEHEKDEDREKEKFKQLINQIKYYFSIENLCKDMYLRKQMDNEGFIPISIIKNFSRVKNLSNGENDKVDLAIENIKELEKKGDKLRIKEGWDKWIFKKRD